MNRTWTVPHKGKAVVIEVDYGAHIATDEGIKDVLLDREGRLVVDGQEVKTWRGGDLPKEVAFDFHGTPAFLRKKGLLNKRLELIIDGRQIEPVADNE